MLSKALRLAALGLVFSAATAEAVPAAEAPSDSGWVGDDSEGRLNVTIPLWLPFLSLDGSLIADTDDGTDTERLETESNVAWVVIGGLEAGYKQVAARLDAFGIGFKDQKVRRNGELSEAQVESSGFVGRGILMYEFGPWTLNKPENQAAVSPVAGARYNRVAIETGDRAELGGTYDWIDPLVGVRSEFRFGDVRLGAHVDFGGFSVGSDLALWAALSAEYMFTSWFAGWVGWQHYQVFFRESSANEVQTLQLQLTGPSAGVSFYIF